MKQFYSSIFICFLWFFSALPTASSETIIIDAVLASIDGKPITLRDLNRRLGRELTFKEVSTDPAARAALDALITERLIEEEAAARKFGVSPEEIERYIGEVSRRNNLSPDDFERALAAEGRSLEQYKEDIRMEILRTKLTSTYLRGAAGVSEEEITRYIKEHPELTPEAGERIKLRQILLRSDMHMPDEIEERLKTVQERIDDGDDFSELAEEFSDGAEANNGGLIGVVAEKDLNPTIFDAIFSLKDGEVSRPIKTAAGYHLFQVEEREKKDEVSDGALRAEVRKLLEERKLESKMASFFTEELYRLHSVDKKI